MPPLSPTLSLSCALVFAAFGARSTLAAPQLSPIPDVELLSGSPLHIPLQGLDPEGRALIFEAEASDAGLVSATVLEGNRSLQIVVQEFGTMTFELFEGRAPRVTGQIVELAESGFYDGVLFHRIIDGFVIQGGDPTGVGDGGSLLGPFDDQFHVDLQHNRSGLLSMAKGADDSNDSQFFITEGAPRELDFNHSIFGLLVSGEDVREAISGVETGQNDRPVTPVVMESVVVITDGQDAVLRLEAAEGSVGTVEITVSAIDVDGVASEQSFRVDITPDTIDSAPFLADIPTLTTAVDTPVTYQLEAIDVEGDPALYLDEVTLTNNGLPVPLLSSLDVDYSVAFDTGLLTVAPLNGVTGVALISVATGVTVASVDYQIVTVIIE